MPGESLKKISVRLLGAAEVDLDLGRGQFGT